MQKEDSKELKSTIASKKCNISEIVGAYISSDGTIRSVFHQDWDTLGDVARGKLKSLIKKSIGSVEDKGYAMLRVGEDEKALLKKLRDEELDNEETLGRLFETIGGTFKNGGKDILVIMAYNAYDVPANKDSDEVDGEVESFEVFRYICCVLCPTKEGEQAINFSLEKNKFMSFNVGCPVNAPVAGFVYPTFANRGTNSDKACVYLKEDQDDFVRELFGEATVEEQNPAKNARKPEPEPAPVQEAEPNHATNTAPPMQGTAAEQEYDATTGKREMVEQVSKTALYDAAEPGNTTAPEQAASEQMTAKLGSTVVPAAPVVNRKSRKIQIHVPKEMLTAVVEQTINGEKCLIIRLADVEGEQLEMW